MSVDSLLSTKKRSAAVGAPTTSFLTIYVSPTFAEIEPAIVPATVMM